MLAAYDVAAEVLGNTRAVCRSCYVHPVVPESYRAGELQDVWKRSRAGGELDRGERTVLKLLGAEPAQRANCSTSALQNAGRSSGLRLDTITPGTWSQTTTSSSTQSAPALTRSVFTLGHDVRQRPLTTSASTSVHGPWQITAIGLCASAKPLTKATASSSARQASGLATPPGSTRPS